MPDSVRTRDFNPPIFSMRIENIYQQIVLWEPLWLLNPNFEIICSSHGVIDKIRHYRILVISSIQKVTWDSRLFVLFCLEVVMKLRVYFMFAQELLLTQTYAL